MGKLLCDAEDQIHFICADESWLHRILAILGSLVTCDVTGWVKFRKCRYFNSIIVIPTSELMLIPNFNFLFHFFEKLFTFGPFVGTWGTVTSQVGSNCEFFENLSPSLHCRCKLVQMQISIFYCIFREVMNFPINYICLNSVTGVSIVREYIICSKKN